MSGELAPVATNGFLTQAMTANDIVAQVQLIQDVMKRVMKDGEHYGVIPGCGSKPALLKAGAEKLCMLFRLDPQFETQEHYDGTHYTVKSKCTVYHITTGQRVGSGEGSCSTKETKYAFRDASRKCPACKKETIIKGKKEYGGGWLCYAKKGGCGGKWADGEVSIESQQIGKVPNDNLADQYNTILKMSNKRALVAATLIATAASDLFTQDIDEDTPLVVIDTEAKVKPGGTVQKQPEPPKQEAQQVPQQEQPQQQAPANGDTFGLTIGEVIGLPDHHCQKCNATQFKVAKSGPKAKNPNRVFLHCVTEKCGEQNGRWFNQTFAGWADEIMPKYQVQG